MSQPNQLNNRFIALKICLTVIEKGRSLSQTLPEGLAQFSDRRERNFTQNLVLGTIRWQGRLEAIRSQLLKKKLKAKDEDINQLILLGLYQIIYMDTPEHAAVSETVAVVQKLKKPWAKALVNGVLRNFIREQESICTEADLKPSQKYAHPQWFFKAMREAYPEDWQSILEANNQIAPLTLRVNRIEKSREDYLKLLAENDIEAMALNNSAEGIQLATSTDITQLPGYDEGWFSVQDGAAQQAGYILKPKPQEHILDACAAPGGKTTHLLEQADNRAKVQALEVAPDRIDRLAENLHRLGLEADYQVGDAAQPDRWWNGQEYDKILLDAPCSATGIIRRHPDIKQHRTLEDVEELVVLQTEILNALWPTLKTGGQLLYATCSVLPQENTLQMQNFIENQTDAELIPLNLEGSITFETPGNQFLPGSNGMDGFFYCLLKKN